ncbi:MAG: hypothetical protein M1365_09550 [Actinobacteria bacterium]|nr:hypothetical protein [Actinomycetota bacterium]
MKILLAEKNKNLISALTLMISQIKDSSVKEIGTVLHVDNADNLYKELKKEKPDILIINDGFIYHKIREAVPIMQGLYPDMTILILSIYPELEKKYSEIGIKDFILKGDSAEDFYASMVSFLKKEQTRISN